MKKIVWDLDGTLRNLHPIIRRKFGLLSPKTYGDWSNDGLDIYDLVKKDYGLLTRAKPTKYVRVIQKYLKANKDMIEIWSYQPQDWIKPTISWIKKYFSSYISYWLLPKDKYKRLLKEKNTLLIDDYPHHPNYDRIILIDQKYNQHVKAKMRVKNVNDLRRILKENI